MGIKQVLSTPRSPWRRAYEERLIGTIRRECLDHMIVSGRIVSIPVLGGLHHRYERRTARGAH